MIEIRRRIGPFKISEIWFSDDVFDIEGAHQIQFNYTTFSGNKKNFSKTIHQTVVLDLNRRLEDIWDSMDRRTCSHQISMAFNDDFVIRFNQRFSEFYEINREFRKYKGLPPLPLSLDEMKKNYFLATYEKYGKVMGGHLCLKDNHRIRQMISANCRNSMDEVSPDPSPASQQTVDMGDD